MARFLENTASVKREAGRTKKKKKQETTQKKVQSPSVSQRAQETNQRLTQKYGGGSTRTSSSSQRNNQTQQNLPTRRYQNTMQSRNPRMLDSPTNQRRYVAPETTNGGSQGRRNQQYLEEDRKRRQKESEERRQAAQRQKMGMNSMATAEEQQAARRMAKNTPSVLKESAKQVGIGHGKTLADVTALNESSAIGSKIDIKSKEFQEDIERRRKKSTEKSKEAFTALSGMQERSEAKMAEKNANAKGFEKAYYGALESGTGMLADRALGPAWAVSMFSRTYGNTRGKAQKEGATESEDRANALLQAAKETATEYMFRGAGLAKGLSGKWSLAPAEKLANLATRNMKGPMADTIHAGIRLLGGVGEENIEEAAAWGVEPLIEEYTYKRNVRARKAQATKDMLRDQSDSLRSSIESPEQAEAVASYLNSPDFIESNVQTYKDSGMSEKDARELAESMRDYLAATMSGDTDTMADIEDKLSSKFAGKGLSKEDWSISELMDTFAATTLLTGVTGLPGAASTAMRGSAIRDQLGNEGVRALADTAIDFEDKTASLKAQAMRERMDSGKDITSTQAYDLMQATREQYAKDSKRQDAAYQTARRAMDSERLVTPYQTERDGSISLDEVTADAYQASERSAREAINEVLQNDEKTSLTDTKIDRGSQAIAGFQTGVFTVDDANELNFRNTAVRDAFKAETGIDLSQYIVKGKDGEVDIPATNTKTKEALFALAADNLVKSAQAETANWMDNVKGEVVTQVSQRMGSKGTIALQQALDTVDERDRAKYMTTANATDMLYHAAREMGTAWENVKDYATRMYKGISEEKLKAMYDAGLADRDMASDKARGAQTVIGEAISETTQESAPMGELVIETETPVKGTVARVFSELADNLGVDIHLVDKFVDNEGNVLKNVNGEYRDGAIYINVNSSFEQNVGYIFMHEVTHHLKMFAPEQFNQLEELVREKWFQYDAAQMQSEIAKKIELYKAHGQTLTEEQALEEIIADAAHEFINDPNFAQQVAEENPSLAKAVLNSIRNALRMLRRVLATGSIEDETHMNTLFSQLGILDEAERLWLNAYTQAVANKAAVGIEDLQNRIYEAGRSSYSISEDTNGRELSEGQKEFFKDSKARDENGRLIPLYHTTDKGGFTIFDPSKSDDQRSLFFASNFDVSQTYAKNADSTFEFDENAKFDSWQDFDEFARETFGLSESDSLAREFDISIRDENGRTPYTLGNSSDAMFKSWRRLAESGDSKARSYTVTMTNPYSGQQVQAKSMKSLLSKLERIMVTHGQTKGYYEAYLNITNPLEVDAEGSMWNEIEFEGQKVKTRKLAEIAEERGYDGVIIRNTVDIGNQSELKGEKESDIYIAFSSEQVKDVRNENPTENPDIRYSIAEDPAIEDLDQHNATVEDEDGNGIAHFQEDGSAMFSISSYDAEGRDIYKKYLDKMVNDGELSQKEADDMLNELETVYRISKQFADKTDKNGDPIFAPFSAWSYADVVTDAKGKPVFSAIKKNSEYKMNIDFSTICKKRRTLDAVFREMINRGMFEKLDLNKDESAAMVVNINDLIRQHKFEAACALCFVEARRYRQQQTATTFRDMWNELVESMYTDKSKIAYFNFGQDSTVEDVADGIHTMSDEDLDLSHLEEIANAKKNGKPVQTAEAKAARLILKDPSQRKLMRVGDMMASTGFENMQIQNPELMKIYNSKKGTGGAKSSFGDVQYLNEMLKSKTFDRMKAYAVSGVRIQSFSDYVPRMVFDYVQVIADLAAKKLPAHAYTKEVLFARQFGLTGAKINLSLVPDVVPDGKAPGLDSEGNYIWNEEGTFPYDEAMKLQEAEGYKENCGTIAVGISDVQIMKMLADPTIQMVIPYHKSSLNPIVAAMTNVNRFKNYEDVQNTKDAEGKSLSSKKDFNWDNKLFRLTHDTKGNLKPKNKWGNVQDLVKEYAEWCEKKGYTPKFADFLYARENNDINGEILTDADGNKIINPGYYKLLEDFALLDNDGNFKPQGDVQMRFPTESDAFGSMENLIEQGLSEDTALEAKRSAEIGGIVDEIEGLFEEGKLTEQSATSEKLAARMSISEDSDGNILTDGQMEYFKNSQARDDEGRLVPVYHTTNNGGFTIFDPKYSDDNRSLFFASNFDVSQTYGWRADKPIQFLTEEEQGLRDVSPFIAGDDIENKAKRQHGYYTAYLNLENPLIVDARGDSWNDIRYGDDAALESQTIYKFNEFYVSFGKHNKDGEPTKLYFQIEGEKKHDDHYEPYEVLKQFDVPNDISEVDLKFTSREGILLNQLYDYWSNELGFNDMSLRDLFDEEMTFSGELQYKNADRPLRFDLIGERLYETEENYTTRELAEMAEANGNDGVIIRNCRDIGGTSHLKRGANPLSDIYIAFSSNQVKDTRNENPSENPDIRYSFVSDDELAAYVSETAESMDEMYFTDPELEEGRVRLGKAKADFIFSKSTKWNQRWLTEGLVLDEKKTRKAVKEAVMNVMSKAEGQAKYKNELVNEAMKTCKRAFYLMKIGKFSEAGESIYDLSKKMVEDNNFFDDAYEETFNSYVELRDHIKSMKLYVPDLGAEEYAEHRRNDMGKIWLCSEQKGTPIDEEWDDLCRQWPEWFDINEAKPTNMLYALEHALEAAQPMAKALCSEEAVDYIDSLANQLYDIVYEGEEYQSIADEYKASAEKKTAAMKVRFTEAMQKMDEMKAQHRTEIQKLKAKNRQNLKTQKMKYEYQIAELKQNREYNIQRLKAEKQRAVREEKQKNKQRAAERKAKAIHKKHFDSITKNYKKLVDRLLTNTKDKNIPEIFKKELANTLAAFDLQTIASKESETHTSPADKYGNQYVRVEPSNKTIQMMLLRSQLEKISEDTEDFQIRGPIVDLLKRLSDNIEGKTIDELNESEIADVDDMLKALVHEFNEYKRVTIEGKKQEYGTIASAQIEHCLAHAEALGQGKDYFGMLGAIDNIMNMDEVTPAYLFRRIDPERNGIGKMYREIRKSFDKYVRNQAQLNEWMNEILGPYQNSGKAWNKYGADQIAAWRDVKNSQPFNLTNGSISLTPAQMMSLYCLKNRPQAMKHIKGAGVVIAPVSFQAKLHSDVKKRMNKTTPVILNDAEIKLIVGQMTKEQIAVAEKLQQLMVNQMAEWGNEASMDVMGIRLFKEKDYFPIKSDKAALKKELNDTEFVQAIRNFGFAKAVEPKASNAIVIDDIFDVVAEHCNNMNLYNAYSKSMDDFMKVYNFHQVTGEGDTYRDISVEQALSQAFSKKAPKYIMTFLRDLNGNVSGNRTGIEDMMNKALGNAKKAAVFANGRVALQQPTAIARAFAEIDPKYLKGIAKKPSKESIKATMDEMFEHCPIALWKSWGYYDINMGKSIEDIMMNEGNWLEDRMTDLYGKLDNITWTAIWQMCKAEVEDKHSDVEKGSDEYWELVNDRMTDVVDFTQVVDSPMHRSHAMRSKGIIDKLATSFMAEPTLTYNMIRDGLIRTYESAKMGDMKSAGKIIGKTVAVYVFATALTSAFAAVWDAVRGKKPNGDDDDDKDFFGLWLANFFANMSEDIKPWNKIYYVKDVKSLIDGWEYNNMALQGWKSLSDGWAQLTGTRYVKSKKSWYENLLGGLGTLTGLPTGTLIKDAKAIYHLIGVHVPLFDYVGEYLDELPERYGGGQSGSGSSDKSSSKTSDKETTVIPDGKVTKDNKAVVRIGKDEMPIDIKDGSMVDNFLNHFGINLTAAEIAEAKEAEAENERQRQTEKIREKYADLSGEARDKKVWSAVTTYIKDNENDGRSLNEFIHDGDYKTVERVREMYLKAGGDEAYFTERILATSKTELKKTISADNTPEQVEAQQHIKDYMLEHGVTEDEISEVAYKSYTARDLKAAIMLNDVDAAVDELTALAEAGLTYDDFERLWDNRKKFNIKSYKKNGKYADRFKSTGTYNWPINGQITSGFGHRNSPGGIGSTNHQGLDIAGSMGDPVAASDGGIVIKAGWYGGAGKTVMIKHDDGTVTQYSHLSWWGVHEGDIVGQGQTIGNVGSTGNSTGPHLHFAVMVNDSYVDPTQYLNKR